MTPPAQPPIPAADQADTPEPEPSLGDWLRSNGPTLAILAALFLYLYWKFDSDGLWAIAKAALGLGFVIFVHELGHFLVAKWCDVHVTTFSIGFGPAIPGCVFKWGETTYKLALLPLGGYVQMVGQVDGDESTDEGAVEDLRSYRNKTVWQRMAIISAGVIMNVILAVICFIIVFKGPGKDRKAAVPDSVDSGGPAAQHGLQSAAEIYNIDGVEDPYFEDLMIQVMTRKAGSPLPFAFGLPGKEHRKAEIEPRKDPTDSRPMIGVRPASIPVLDTSRYYPKTVKSPTESHSAAARAKRVDGKPGGLEFGDRIIATTDPADPKKITKLPFDERMRSYERKHKIEPASGQLDYFEMARRLHLLAGSDVVLRIEREVDGKTQTLDFVVPPVYHRTFGAVMRMGQITLLRKNGPGENAVERLADGKTQRMPVKARERDKSHDGDVIVRVEVKEPDGSITRFPEYPVQTIGAMFQPAELRGFAVTAALIKESNLNSLDPLRLPDQLRQWARRMAEAGKKDERVVVLHIIRDIGLKGQGAQNEPKRLELTWNEEYEDNKEIPMTLSSPLSIPGLGIGYRVKTTIGSIDPKVTGVAAVGTPGIAAGAATAAGVPDLAAVGPNPLRPGDIIKEFKRFTLGDTPEEAAWGPWVSLESEQWALIFQTLQLPAIKEVALKVERGGSVQEITLQLREAKDWPRASDTRGMLLASDLRRQHADGIGEAIGLGLKDTKNSILQVYQNLQGMISGRISVENLGGPVTIARVAYYIAGVDFWEFVFFLGLISVNLAVINFLPIPVLDGGHMVFLIYEKIRGKPASEGVRVGATYAGLLLLASLMIFVLFLDIKRLL